MKYTARQGSQFYDVRFEGHFCKKPEILEQESQKHFRSFAVLSKVCS